MIYLTTIIVGLVPGGAGFLKHQTVEFHLQARHSPPTEVSSQNSAGACR